MTTQIAFKRIANTPENLRLAEDELDVNTLGLEEGQIVEERKTLQWLKDGSPLEFQAVDDPAGVGLNVDAEHHAGTEPNGENIA